MRTLQDNDSSPERKTALVCFELKKYNIDIAALNETRLAGISHLTEVKGGYEFYWSGKSETEPRHSGVGFAIRSDLARTLPLLPGGFSDRIMTLTLELEHDTRAVLVSCYAPTLASPEQEKDNFYNQLRSVISGIRYKDKIILMGDFNARVGSDLQSYERCFRSSWYWTYELERTQTSFFLQRVLYVHHKHMFSAEKLL